MKVMGHILSSQTPPQPVLPVLGYTLDTSRSRFYASVYTTACSHSLLKTMAAYPRDKRITPIL